MLPSQPSWPRKAFTDLELEKANKKLTEAKSLLTEKDNQLTEKDNQLKSMAQAMLDNGMSIEVIAQAMGKNVSEIRSLLRP